MAGHRRKKRGRKPLDPALPREVVRHELPEAERCARMTVRPWSRSASRSASNWTSCRSRCGCIQHQRVKYACPCCDQGIKITPAPARIIPKGLLTEAALAWVVTSKYQDSLPLYRQAALLGRFGGDLSRNTLAASMVRVGEAVQPIINLLRDHLLEADLIFGDETVIQVLKEPGRAAQTQELSVGADERYRAAGPPVRLCPGPRRNPRRELYAGIREARC